jgi:hypothetical protein
MIVDLGIVNYLAFEISNHFLSRNSFLPNQSSLSQVDSLNTVPL